MLIFIQYVKEIDLHTTHSFLKPTIAKFIMDSFIVSIFRGKRKLAVV